MSDEKYKQAVEKILSGRAREEAEAGPKPSWFTRIFGPKPTAIKFFLAGGIIILMGEARAEEFSLMSLVGYGMILPAFLMLGADGK